MTTAKFNRSEVTNDGKFLVVRPPSTEWTYDVYLGLTREEFHALRRALKEKVRVEEVVEGNECINCGEPNEDYVLTTIEDTTVDEDAILYRLDRMYESLPELRGGSRE